MCSSDLGIRRVLFRSREIRARVRNQSRPSARKARYCQIEIEKGYIKAKCKKLKGAVVTFPFPSVGATENIMMAAVLAEGILQIGRAHV